MQKYLEVLKVLPNSEKLKGKKQYNQTAMLMIGVQSSELPSDANSHPKGDMNPPSSDAAPDMQVGQYLFAGIHSGLVQLPLTACTMQALALGSHVSQIQHPQTLQAYVKFMLILHASDG